MKTRALLPLPCAAALTLAACGDDVGQTTETPGTTAPATGDTDPPPDPTTGGGLDLVCLPGAIRCADAATVEVCKNTGLEYEQTACGKHQECTEGTCIGPCEKVALSPTSIGCEFLALRTRSGNSGDEETDALIVGNTDEKETAELRLYVTASGSHKEEQVGEPVLLAPGESHLWELSNSRMPNYSSVRNGGVYRVVSDIPVAAYLHSTLANSASNDSSMLLPTHALRADYVVAAYPGFVDVNQPDTINGRPSYFMAIALADETTVEWTPQWRTAGDNLGVPAIEAGATGKLVLNRFDVLQIGASSRTLDGLPDFQFKDHDISGTQIHADKQLWILGATECAYVPFGSGYCNHLQEQMIPYEYWGETYVGAHSPLRAEEQHYWRVFAGEDNVTVTVDADAFELQPIQLAKRGDWAEVPPVPSGVHVVFAGTGAFMPVQYLAGAKAAGGKGDPSMYQTVPVEQWLERYVFVTGKNYATNIAQLIRAQHGPPITLNGVEIPDADFTLVTSLAGNFEIAEVPLQGGDQASSYFAVSDAPFSVSVVGYNSQGGWSAYAYPGGMALKELIPP